jgi:antibiotic biosynthesis monooxygenase (ABM) superfamily enzyme
MIERHIRFTVPADGEERFREFIETAYVPPMSDIGGFVSARLLRPSGGEGEILMVLQFEDAAASAGWRESPAHANLQTELKTLHSGMVITGYESL